MPVPQIVRHSARIGGHTMVATTDIAATAAISSPAPRWRLPPGSPCWAKSRGRITPRLDDFRRTAVDTGRLVRHAKGGWVRPE
jgi:hypothetical protein